MAVHGMTRRIPFNAFNAFNVFNVFNGFKPATVAGLERRSVEQQSIKVRLDVSGAGIESGQ